MSSDDHIGGAWQGIAALRESMGLTQADFAERIGLSNKATVSLIERGQIPCSLKVALAIEELSGGRIDAGAINDDVRAARERCPESEDTGADGA